MLREFQYTNDFTKVIVNSNKQYTFAEYIDFCKKYPEEKFELVNGQIILIAGASKNHNRITRNFDRHITSFLEENHPKYELFTSDIRLEINKLTYRYPDFLVDCNGNSSDVFAIAPTIVGEVLSKGTEKVDRNEKLDEYKSVQSIQEIILISQHTKSLEVYCKNRLSWSKQVYVDGLIKLVSIGYSISIDDIYKRVEFDNN